MSTRLQYPDTSRSPYPARLEDAENFADMVPERIIEGLTRYVTAGVAPGSFLRAVLENSLWLAVKRADVECRRCLPEIVDLLHEAAPSDCWGSEQIVREWLRRGEMTVLLAEAGAVPFSAAGDLHRETE